MVIGAVLFYDLMDIFRLIEAATAEGDRKSLELGVRRLRGIVEYCGRIDASTQPNAQGNVREQMLAKRALHQAMQFFFGGIECPVFRWTEWQTPVQIGTYLSIAPFQPITRRKFFDAVDKCPRARHIIQREVTIQAREADAALDFGVSENRFELRAEEKIFALAADVQRLNAHAIARQHNALLGFTP